MPDRLKILGQSEPASTTDTDLYTVPSGNVAVCSSLVVCNRAGSATTFRVAIRQRGAAISGKHYIYYDAAIDSKETIIVAAGMSLQESDVVTVWSNNGSVAFNLFGVEAS